MEDDDRARSSNIAAFHGGRYTSPLSSHFLDEEDAGVAGFHDPSRDTDRLHGPNLNGMSGSERHPTIAQRSNRCVKLYTCAHQYIVHSECLKRAEPLALKLLLLKETKFY